MNRPRIVDLELEDLCANYNSDTCKTLEYIEALEKKVEKLKLQLYGTHCDTEMINPPTNLAM